MTQPTSTLFTATCPSCNTQQQIPSHYHGRTVKCLKCSHSFLAESDLDIFLKNQQRESEAEQQRIRKYRSEIVLYLQQHKNSHYVSLDADNRKSIEEEYAAILTAGMASWGEEEQNIHLLLSTMHGRAEWMDIIWRSQVLTYLSEIATNQASIQTNQVQFADALNEIAAKLGTIKVAAGFGGMLAAGELGKQFGASFGGEG